MQPVRIDDPTYIEEFCHGDCHLLAYALYFHYEKKASCCEMMTCIDPRYRHTFLHIKTRDGDRYLDGHGIHTTLLSVFKPFNIEHEGELKRIPLHSVEPNNERIQRVVKESDRYQKFVEPLEGDTQSSCFSDLLTSLAMNYLWRTEFRHTHA